MKLRIKEVARSKGVDLQTLSKRLGITYQALNARMNGNPSLKVLTGIANVLGVSIIELLQDDLTEHHYNVSGDWMGVYPKK